jgi:starch synthase
MRVLFVSAEVSPFAKTGGLADVALALPRALASLGIEMRVVMPKYRQVNEKAHLTKEAEFDVPVGRERKPCVAYRDRLPGSAVPIYFLDNAPYFDRPQIYGEGSEYPDALERFTFLSRGALKLCEAQDWTPDVIHVNDWHAALVPALAKSAGMDRFSGATSILTIHNLAYQGVFPVSQAGISGLSQEELAPYLQGDRINLLKGGILSVDLVNTVSPTYAREILDAGVGLEEALRSRREVLFGVLNGVDTEEWNPGTDEHLWARYTADDPRGKAENKRAMQAELGLTVDPKVPVVGVISRLAEQKGFDLIMPAFDRLMDLGIQFVLLGTGAPEYEAFFRQRATEDSSRVAALLTFSEQWAHRIEAAADVFLMPSRFEPCGLNQQYSLRYGTVPVVRSTGGLKDTVAEYDAAAGTGNGFAFEAYTQDALVDAATRAVRAYREDPSGWSGLMRRGMSQDFSWTASARAYLDLYRKAAG